MHDLYFKPLLAVFVCFIAACGSSNHSSQSVGIDPYQYKSVKDIDATNGAVVSAHPLASQVGVEILKKGGNAMDAAIATQLALAVVYPGAGNIGGGGFTVARLADGRLLALDYREKAPGHASRDMYVDADGTPRTDKSQNGHLSSGVPGTVAGLFEEHKYATLPFATLIQPAIDLAEKGFVITEHEAGSLNSIQDELKKYNSRSNAFMKASGWKGGDTLIQKDLAATLRRIAEQGADGFYKGTTAKLIAEEMQRGAGIITEEDLANYKVASRPAHVFDYKNYQVVSMPMPSSGGLLLNQMMKMVESRPLAQMGYNSPEAVQLMTEVERRAYADRGEYMGDLDFYKVPVKELTDTTYLANRMKDYQPGKAGNSKTTGPGKPGHESEETTHLSVIDNKGNAVSITTTLNNGYGSRTVVGGAGFFLNDEMDDFSIKPGVPNMYGAVGGEANAIAPNKRMLSSMTPTVVLKDNKPYIVVGTPGGTTIPTSVFQTLIDILDFGMNTHDAVNGPKFHHQWLPDVIYVEKDFPQATIDALKKMGYSFDSKGGIGRVEAIRVTKDGHFEAVADHRGDDSAAGY